MSNIFNFRPKDTESLNSDFLRDADDTVEFDLSGREVQIGDVPQHFLLTKTPDPVVRDWSNQELANIYRVKKLLDAAGVPNTLERGITDEGDPWCIFCTMPGDVFIHLCRVDGRYTLDSPNLRSPITGVDFADLIAEFSAGALAAAPTKDSRRIIKLQRNGKVFLHPSALLAALIWSIYINSEDLVMLAPEEGAPGLGADDSIQLINETALAPLSDSEATSVAQFMDAPLLPDQIIGARLADAATLRADTERDGTMFRDFAGKSAMVASAMPVAVGLSSIAIAFGIMSETFFDPASDTDMAALDLPTSEDTDDTLVTDQLKSDDSTRNAKFDLVAVLQTVLDHAPTTDVAPSALSVEIGADIDLSTLLSSILALPGPADVAINLASDLHENWGDETVDPVYFSEDPVSEQETAANDGETTKTNTARQDALVETADISITSTPPDTAFDFASVLDFTASLADAFKTFDFGGVKVQATFDIANIVPSIDAGAGTTPTASEPTITDLLFTGMEDPADTIDLGALSGGTSEQGFDAMDVNARAFIQHLMSLSRVGEVEIIQTSNELVLIDFDALSGAGQETHSMGWTLADGNTVYTIGLKEDFLEFDLIA